MPTHFKHVMESVLLGLSVLELCLLVAMSHLTEKLDDKPFNCEMVYQGELQALQATS
jgi:hypothetical protein